MPELTDALPKISTAPSGIPDDAMYNIERFVVLLSDRTSTCKGTDKANKKLFTKKNDVQLIPPTKSSLEELVKRVAMPWYQHKICLLRPAGAGSIMTRGCTSHTGRSYPKQPTPTMN